MSRNLVVGGAILLGVIGGGFGIVYLTTIHGKQKTHDSDPARFDPVAAYPEVSGFAGRAYDLHSIDAMAVRSDGTVDLTADYGPMVTYRFVGKARNTGPVGAPNATMQPFAAVVATDFGWQEGGQDTRGYQLATFALGLHRYDGEFPRAQSASAPPKCSFADLWKVAIAEGAPAGAVAMIEYEDSSYWFEIEGTEFEIGFDANCKLTEKKQTDAEKDAAREAIKDARDARRKEADERKRLKRETLERKRLERER